MEQTRTTTSDVHRSALTPHTCDIYGVQHVHKLHITRDTAGDWNGRCDCVRYIIRTHTTRKCVRQQHPSHPYERVCSLRSARMSNSQLYITYTYRYIANGRRTNANLIGFAHQSLPGHLCGKMANSSSCARSSVNCFTFDDDDDKDDDAVVPGNEKYVAKAATRNAVTALACAQCNAAHSNVIKLFKITHARINTHTLAIARRTSNLLPRCRNVEL